MKNILPKTKEFLSVNWFKLSIILLIFFTFICTGIYLVNSNHAKIIAEKEEDCRITSIKYKADNLIDQPDISYYSYEFNYNRKTDTCIIAYIEDSSGFFGGRYYKITDLFSGKEILSKLILDRGQPMLDEQKIFDTTKDKYFNNSGKY